MFAGDSLWLWVFYTMSSIFAIVFGISLVRFTFFRESREDGQIKRGSNVYTYAMVDNAKWHFHSRVSGIIITLPKRVPHIILDSVTNDMNKDLGITIAPGQELLLEGDFNQNFIAFTPRASQSEAREILTPDVMTVIKEHFKDYELEFYENRLTIITPQLVRDNNLLHELLLEVSEKIISELDHKFRSYQGTENTAELNISSAGVVRVLGGYYSPVYVLLMTLAGLLTLPTFIFGVYMMATSSMNFFVGILLIVFSVVLFGLLFKSLIIVYQKIYRTRG